MGAGIDNPDLLMLAFGGGGPARGTLTASARLAEVTALRLEQEGHVIARHGPQVTTEQLFERAITGRAPDGSIVVRDGEVILPAAATAFKSMDDLIVSELLVRQNALPAARAFLKPGQTTITIEGFPVGRSVGQGFVPPGRTLDVAGPPAFASDISRVTASFKYNPTTNFWETVTLYPSIR
jgi:hypothetical protein